MEEKFAILILVSVLILTLISIIVILSKKNRELKLSLKGKDDENNKLEKSLQEEKLNNAVLEEKVKKFEENENYLKENISNLEEHIQQLRSSNSSLSVENGELKTKIEEIEKANRDKIDILLKSEEKLKESFENLANQVLEKTNDKITKNSQTTLSAIINPLQLQMKEFKEKIEFLNREENEKLTILQQELKNLKDVSFKLSSDAENLTKALKGEVKTQGNWGELVLERVLELSGLEKGREYEREVVLKHDGDKYRPDVIIYLPNERNIIIDAKTSLNAYQNYIKTEDKSYIKSHISAIKNHINTLSDKRYENLEGINSLDFVFMFIPIENALMLALENDSRLFEYAFKQKVILVSPTTLLVSLRAIESSWRFERQAKNIQEVVKTAENLYDKVRLFSEDFEKIGKHIDTAYKSYESGKKRLTDGKGSVLRQVEILKEKAKIKPKKEITL